jgi:murein DD-endopeptidase MepM/ murein hydrolase activator NlpD
VLSYIRIFAAVFLVLNSISVFADSLDLKGHFTQGGAVRGFLPPNSDITLDDRKVPQTPDGYFVFGFGRDAKSESVISWLSGEGVRQVKVLSISKREYPTQRVEGVPQKTVTPAASKLERIRQEAALVRKARAEQSGQVHFLSKFIVPLDGPITGVYGSQRVYNGVPKRPHFGIDYAAPTGTPVIAPAAAEVRLAHNNMYYSGGTLVMDHGYGLSSTFIHLSEILVKEGQKIKQGQVVGKVGAGGRASGPHLDWRLNWFEVRLDPALILDSATFE